MSILHVAVVTDLPATWRWRCK